MPDGRICSWDDWINNLTEEQRQYEIWRILSELSELQNRKNLDRVIQFLGSLMGGAIMIGIFGFAKFFIG